MALLARLFPTVLSPRLPHEVAIDRVEPERDAQAPRLGGLARPSVRVLERRETPQRRLGRIRVLDERGKGVEERLSPRGRRCVTRGKGRAIPKFLQTRPNVGGPRGGNRLGQPGG